MNSDLEQHLPDYIKAVLAVIVVTILMYAIGRDILGEAVIALLYLLPVGWAAARWGQGPGTLAAVAAALAFDFFFIPPFFTFTVGRLEGWLVLGIFLAVAIVIVGNIQSGLARARQREHEAILMFEISTALASTQSPQAVVQTIAARLQQVYQADLVQVSVQLAGQADPKDSSLSMVTSVPATDLPNGRADRLLPIVIGPDLVGEIRLWSGKIPLPPVEDRIMQAFAHQTALALERARLSQAPVVWHQN